MKRGTSLYLDLVRFSAAMMVFLEHFREHTRNSFAWFWRSHQSWYFYSGLYSQIAVAVFFVLSGYVIAHVLATRENTPHEYAASRFARLYSVVVPALCLVATTNYLEALKYPDAFRAFVSNSRVLGLIYYAGTALFVNRFWLWPDLEPPNIPFWSLSFEASYYVGIALFVFARGYMRFLSLLLLSVVAGPTMVLLAPTWFIGYAAYHISQRQQPRTDFAIVLWLASAVLLLLCPFIELRFRQDLTFLRMPDHHLGGLLVYYAAAICFAANLLTFNALATRAELIFLPFSVFIRWLGSITFALYMFHQPLLSFFSVYPIGESAAERSSIAQATLLIGGTLLVVATLGRWCEQSKGAYKRFFLTVWNRAIALHTRHGAQTP
jgi:peptidoglycan/LPS O-acetylase OafA/YrhL